MTIAIIILLAVAAFLALVLWTDTLSPDAVDTSAGYPAVIASGWSSFTVHLFQNNITFDFTTTLGGLTECNFTGYSAVTPGAAAAQAPVGKVGSVLVPNCVFTRSSTGTPQTAYGYYIKDGSGNLLGGGTFPAPGPYTFATSGDKLTLSITETVTVVP